MIFTSGLSVPEGPVLLPDESWLVVEMGSDRGCVTHISPDGQAKRVIAKTGRPNGLAVDKDGVIWAAESQTPSLLHLTIDGKVEVFLTECNGEPFLFPNDLAFGPDGALYMTDSGILFEEFAPGGKVRPDYMEVYPDGRVYRIDVKTREIEKLDSGIRFTNGIAFDAEGNLYVNETLTGMVYRYQWQDGEIGEREDFGNVVDPEGPEGIKGPDGMKFGANGHLYVTVVGQGDVTVLGPNGAVVERIKTEGSAPTNLAFGPPGAKKIYVTEDEFGAMEVFEVGIDGLPLCAGE
ncbi:MAG: SMP-30/gluconolactonase/LRE family protein [Anaerolineae bacterium]